MLGASMVATVVLSVLLLSAASASAASEIQYGVTATTSISSVDVQGMSDAGVDVLRLGIDWGEVQPAPAGPFHWRHVDDVVLAAAGRGIEVTPYLYGRPSEPRRCADPCLRRAPRSRQAMQRWGRFVEAAAARFGTQGTIWSRLRGTAPPAPITTWEVWARPNATAFRSRGSERGDGARAYARLLAMTSRSARMRDPAASVVAGVLSVGPKRGARTGMRTGRFVRDLLDAGAGESIAAVAVEPRGRSVGRLGRRIERIRSILSRRGQEGIKIVVAPIGWASDHHRSRRMSVGPRRQGALLGRAFGLIERNAAPWAVEAVVWSAWRDGGRSRGCDWCPASGLVARTGEPKPSLRAFEGFASSGPGDQTPEPDPAPAAVDPRFFGVVPGMGVSAADVRTMGQVGVGTMRLAIPWSTIQPGEAGPYDWRYLDQTIGALAQQGITMLPTVYEDPGEADAIAMSGLAGWRGFVAALVDRYGSGGSFWTSFEAQNPGVPSQPPDAWEIWNEQNGRKFWPPEPSPERYARLLHASAVAIRGEDPRAEVMLGGMYAYANQMTAVDFLRQLYAIPGAADDFDIVALHPYSAGNAGIAAQVQQVRDEMDRQGDAAKDIWITELGWSSVPINNPVYSVFTRDEGGQAEALDSAFRMLLDNRERWELRGVVWYSWRDAAEPACIFCQYTGLLRNDGTPKPSLAAFAALATDP